MYKITTLPPEVLLLISEFVLDNSTILSAMLVCKFWFSIFNNLLLRSIKRSYWFRKTFPLPFYFEWQSPEEVVVLSRMLKVVKDFEWWDVDVHCRDILCIRSSFTIHNRSLSFYFPDIPIFLEHALNITRLSIVTRRSISLPLLFHRIINLRFLKHLEVAIYILIQSDALSLYTLKPLFSKLHSMTIIGNWYFMPIEFDSAETYGTLRKMSIHPNALELVKHCVNIQALNVVPCSDPGPFSLQPVTNCPKLKCLSLRQNNRIEGSFINDVVNTLKHTNIENITSLCFVAKNLSYVEFLCQFHPQDHMHLPNLDSLSITDTNLWVSSSQRTPYASAISNILKTRSKLKKFRALGFGLSLDVLFPFNNTFSENDNSYLTLTRVDEDTGNCVFESYSPEWVCKDIEYLELQLSYYPTRFTFHVKRRTYQEQKSMAVQRLFNQLNSLKKLDHLSIISSYYTATLRPNVSPFVSFVPKLRAKLTLEATLPILFDGQKFYS